MINWKKLMKKISLVLILSLMVGSWAVRAQALDDAILAVINDELITLKDLREYLRAIYLQLQAEGKSEKEIIAMMKSLEENGLNRLIEDKLLLGQANKKGIEIRDKVIEKRINEIKKQYATQEEFLTDLSREGFTLTDLKNKITDQFKVKYLVEMEVESKIFINPQEVTGYYQKHMDLFKKSERVDVQSIFIAYGSDTAQARLKATQAIDLVKSGKDFTGVEKEYSESPSLGVIEKGKLVPIVENVVFNLKEEEVSSLIEIDQGIYIFKVKQKFPAEVTALNKVKEGIYNQLFQQKFRERLESWLKELKEKAYIEIKHE